MDRAEKNSSKSSKLDESDVEIICDRILAVNFAAIHTSTFTVTNLVFDLVSSKSIYIEELREEIKAVLESENGILTKIGLSKMYKLDSALRESSRMGSFIGNGLTRQVMVPEGINAPNGTHLPFGSIVSVPTHGIHYDGNIYNDANEFKPFRFSDLRTGEKGNTNNTSIGENNDIVGNDDIHDAEKDDYIKRANLSFVSTSPNYQAFGHGRHACPGRFFAAHELKLMVAYMILHYDFEMLDKRPEGQWFGPTLVPPMRATIKIKRRSQ